MKISKDTEMTENVLASGRHWKEGRGDQEEGAYLFERARG
jgi:hypothetical protein